MRPPRLLRAVLAAFVLAGTVAGPVSAAPGDPLLLSGPPDGARVAAGAPVPLHARGVAGDVGLELRVSISAQAVDGCGRIGADVARAPGTPVAADASLFAFATAPWYARAGTYFWQVSRTGADGTCETTEVRRLSVTAASTTSPGPATAGLSHARIPRRIGASNGSSYVIRTGGVPAGVSRPRYLALVRNSGRRWGLHSLGTRPGRPVVGNGISEVGFATALVPRAALAVTVFGPPFRAGRAGGPEHDLILRADLPWEQGPAHPTRARVDLETVILHEFGHMAGNRFHLPRGCRNTPMVVGLATGEWWRSPSDFSYRACNVAG